MRWTNSRQCRVYTYRKKFWKRSEKKTTYLLNDSLSLSLSHTHTHTYIYIYVYTLDHQWYWAYISNIIYWEHDLEYKKDYIFSKCNTSKIFACMGLHRWYLTTDNSIFLICCIFSKQMSLTQIKCLFQSPVESLPLTSQCLDQRNRYKNDRPITPIHPSTHNQARDENEARIFRAQYLIFKFPLYNIMVNNRLSYFPTPPLGQDMTQGQF